MNSEPDLDLLYFEPYLPPPTARELFRFLRSSLPFYRVEYDINRGGISTHIKTPRWTTVFGVDETSCFGESPSSASQQGSKKNQTGATEDVQRQSSSSSLSSPPKSLVLLDAASRRPIQPAKERFYARYPPRPIPECLDALRRSAEAATGCTFNFCLVNYYASGSDSISYHSDDERFLGNDPAIASFSLGARRDFLMKHKPPPPPPANSDKTGAQQKQEKPNKPPLKLPMGAGDMILMRGTTQANWLHSIPKRSGRNERDGGRINITFRKAMIKAGTDNYYNYNVGNGPVYRWDGASGEMRPCEGTK